MKTTDLNSYFIKLSMAVVALTGLTLISFLDFSSSLENSKASSKERAPSSESASSSEVEIPKKQKLKLGSTPDVINLKELCDFPNFKKKFVVKNFQVQFFGSPCKLKNSGAKIKIANITNGFVADIFGMPNQEFKTDLMQLSEGMNKIQIDIEYSAQPKETLLIVVTSRRI